MGQWINGVLEIPENVGPTPDIATDTWGFVGNLLPTAPAETWYCAKAQLDVGRDDSDSEEAGSSLGENSKWGWACVCSKFKNITRSRQQHRGTYYYVVL